MQGIPFYQFKSLLGCLDRIGEQSALLQLPAEHTANIDEHKEKLKEVYASYEMSVKKLACILEQYKEQQQAIRRLIVQHKRTKNQLKKKAPIQLSTDIILQVKIA